MICFLFLRFCFKFLIFFFQIFYHYILTQLHGRSKKIFRYHGMSKDLGPAVESKAVDRKRKLLSHLYCTLFYFVRVVSKEQSAQCYKGEQKKRKEKKRKEKEEGDGDKHAEHEHGKGIPFRLTPYLSLSTSNTKTVFTEVNFTK